MKERSLPERVDRYLRREDTRLALTLKKLSPQGRAFRQSHLKCFTEVALATLPAIVALPFIGALALAKKAEDGGSAFYVQKRVGEGGKPVPLVKIRSMRVNADADARANQTNASRFDPENDPRNTRLGRFMRRYELEELPQLWQVVVGQLSLVDIRSAPQYVFDYLRDARPHTFAEWESAYFSGRPGLFNLNAAVNSRRKDDRKRHHYDMLYARKASLGLSYYIIFRCITRVVEKFHPRITRLL